MIYWRIGVGVSVAVSRPLDQKSMDQFSARLGWTSTPKSSWVSALLNFSFLRSWRSKPEFVFDCFYDVWLHLILFGFYEFWRAIGKWRGGGGVSHFLGIEKWSLVKFWVCFFSEIAIILAWFTKNLEDTWQSTDYKQESVLLVCIKCQLSLIKGENTETERQRRLFGAFSGIEFVKYTYFLGFLRTPRNVSIVSPHWDSDYGSVRHLSRIVPF